MERRSKSYLIDYKIWFVLSLTLLGLIIRLDFSKPYWIDEIIFLNLVNKGAFDQVREFIPVHISILTGETRLPFQIAGSLLPLALFIAARNKRNILPYCFIVTFASIFVFWSQLARPYIMGTLFAVLGYRWTWFYLAVIFTNPACLIPNIYKFRWFYLGLFVLAFIVYKMQPLSKLDHFNWEYITHAKRLWLAPLAVGFLHLSDFTDDRLEWIRRLFFRLAGKAM